MPHPFPPFPRAWKRATISSILGEAIRTPFEVQRREIGLVTSNDYELIDFGEGRKLERFGPVVLDRPSPAALELTRARPAEWNQAIGRFDRTSGEQGVWRWRTAPPNPWSYRADGWSLGLAPTRFGHVGMFPEQIPNWKRLSEFVRSANRPLTLLNLFAYSGGSTLAVAGPGHEVVHVDASRSTVDRARQNAALSQKEACRIRWIVDDARVFCRREIKRGRRYDGIILDPPTYGHSPDGKSWSIESELPLLLKMCGELLAFSPEDVGPKFLLLSCHAPMIDLQRARQMVRDSIPGLRRAVDQTERNRLYDRSRRPLDFGLSSYWVSVV